MTTSTHENASPAIAHVDDAGCWSMCQCEIMTFVSERRNRGRPRENPRVEAAVLDATLAEIDEKGLGNCTVEAIAARAGIGKATFYRRWPNKEAVLHFLASQIGHTPEPIDTGDLRKDLIAVFEPTRKEVYGTPVATIMPTFVAEAARDPKMRQFLLTLSAERTSGALEALERAKSRGELRGRVNLEAVVDMMYGAIVLRSLVLGLPVTAAFVRTMIDVVIVGIENQ